MAPQAYLTTGAWSQKAIKEASKYGHVVEVASSKESNFTTIPARESWQSPADARYFHLCTNETIHGVEWFGSLTGLGMPVVADMSSHLLSRSMPIQEIDLIYAGAQKPGNSWCHNCCCETGFDLLEPTGNTWSDGLSRPNCEQLDDEYTARLPGLGPVISAGVDGIAGRGSGY